MTIPTLGEASPDAWTLVVSSTAGVELVHLTRRGECTIGRGSQCDVVVNDPSVSRVHARLMIGARDELTLEDLGSTNGTTVRGARLKPREPSVLHPGTAFEVGTATIAMPRAGLFPSTSPGRLTPAVFRAAAPASESNPRRPPTQPAIVVDPTMRNLHALIDVLAPTKVRVLLLGETGVGKEIFAEAIAGRSDRALKPFLQINCGALAQSILEAELFGYEKGAYTGALQAKAGLFESADGGTVFLDEVGELPPAVQVALLRVLETGEVLRLGSVRPRVVDVRFVAATNRDIRKLVADGRFRADLYFRLNGMTVTIPPLRSRRSEILPLAERFVDRAGAALRKAPMRLTEAAAHALQHHTWPGNVRELKNVIELAVILATGHEIDVEHLTAIEPEMPLGERAEEPPFAPRSADPDAATGRFPAVGRGLQGELLSDEVGRLEEQLSELEKQRILDALATYGGNQTKVAKALRISRYMLICRLKQYGIGRPRKPRE